MVEVQVYDANGKEKEKISFDESVFGDSVKARTLREVVYAYEANRRQGTVNSKNLSDVQGSNKKPWGQKGTGRARTGQKHAPHRTKGSVAHGPHPRSFRVRIPAKMKAIALQSALLAKFRDGQVSVVDGLTFDKPKTSKFAKMLDTSGLARGTLLIGVDKEDRNFYLSARNLQGSLVRAVSGFNAYEVVKQRRMLLTRAALDLLKTGTKLPAEAATHEGDAVAADAPAEKAASGKAAGKQAGGKKAGKKTGKKTSAKKAGPKKAAAKKSGAKAGKKAKGS
ncbi:MAG: 50S ribosomal protein L4 [Planctomycetes bacterium]|nr:50S ribosomal protein L4 [Planctomycetota bacterium]